MYVQQSTIPKMISRAILNIVVFQQKLIDSYNKQTNFTSSLSTHLVGECKPPET